MNDIDNETKELACRLAQADRFNGSYALTIEEGFTVPMWLTYVSRAKQLLIEKNAMSKK